MSVGLSLLSRCDTKREEKVTRLVQSTLANCNHGFTAGQTGYGAGISSTSQLIHQTQPLLLETWQGYYIYPPYPSLSLSLFPVSLFLNEGLPPGVRRFSCKNQFHLHAAP